VSTKKAGDLQHRAEKRTFEEKTSDRRKDGLSQKKNEKVILEKERNTEKERTTQGRYASRSEGT